MRTALLIRTSSISAGTDISAASPQQSPRFHEASGSFSSLRQRRTLSLPAGKPKLTRLIRSEADLNRSVPQSSCRSRWSPPTVLTGMEEHDLAAGKWKGVSSAAVVKENAEVEHSGGSGKGKGIGSAGGNFGDNGNEKNNGNRMIENYYQEMLRADPRNPLLLRNYGRFLHEVERDLKKAEEYYERAILACPGDGEVLSLYARLIWDSQRDSERAESYHERAVEASPDDCYVMGAYAHFLWDAEEDSGP